MNTLPIMLNSPGVKNPFLHCSYYLTGFIAKVFSRSIVYEMAPPAKRPRQEEADNCIRVRVPKVSQLKEGDCVSSHRKVIGGFPWELTARKSNDRLDMQLLPFQDEKSSMWCCKILSVHSPKFHKYFYGDNKDEKKAFEEVLEDVDEDVLCKIGILDEADKSLQLMKFDTEVLFFWAEKYKLFCLQVTL
ncbi:hypothetical protein PRIPAC_76695 [Pristionchus pacificus]|uniref:Uncharacterized protein n=1 Tax=Pristionchus pacificus TaxID=54126 RepID=A0A2A6BZP0_PRIPA|nr:hypothetical protein PRIPAC_76695 [Pristionchus pacificus]|eukprot:PDM71350.1 hypothetical protein PRIPAC_37757 [Pristionchus pacificus]